MSFAFSPFAGVDTAAFAHRQPLRATPTHGAGGAEKTDTLFEFREAPGGPQWPVKDGEAIELSAPRRALTAGDTTLFARDSSSPAPILAEPSPAVASDPNRPSDSLFESTVEPLRAPDGGNKANLKAALAALLAASTPPGGKDSLDAPSRSPTPLGALPAGRFQAGIGAPTPGSVLKGLPERAPQLPVAPAGLPRRSLGGAALRRASMAPGRRATIAPPFTSVTLAPAPLTYVELLDTLNVAWKEHSRARRSSAAPGADPAPSTLAQALRLFCLTAPRADGQAAEQAALEEAWTAAERGAAQAAAEADAHPSLTARAAAAALATRDDAALTALRDSASALQRAAKESAKAAVSRVRLDAGAAQLASLQSNLAMLAEQLASVEAARGLLAEAAAGVAALGVDRNAEQQRFATQRQAASADHFAAARQAAAAEQRRVAAAAADRDTADALQRERAAMSRLQDLRKQAAAATAHLASAREHVGGIASRSAMCASDAAASLERGAEADILASLVGWQLATLTPDGVVLALDGGIFQLCASFTADGVAATAKILPPPPGTLPFGRFAPDRSLFAASLAAPLECTGPDMPRALRPLALRCARATEAVLELDRCVAAFPRLSSARCVGRTVTLSFILLQPAMRKITVALELPESADPDVAFGACNAAVLSAPEDSCAPVVAEIYASLRSMGLGQRRLLRACRILDDALLGGLTAPQR